MNNPRTWFWFSSSHPGLDVHPPLKPSPKGKYFFFCWLKAHCICILHTEDEHLGYISATLQTRKIAAALLYASQPLSAVEIGCLLFFMLTNQPEVMAFVVKVFEHVKIHLEELKKPPKNFGYKDIKVVDLEMCMTL
ncbi:hypothetical protein Hanom_Chr10g00955171 [Helianthus anomalus]